MSGPLYDLDALDSLADPRESVVMLRPQEVRALTRAVRAAQACDTEAAWTNSMAVIPRELWDALRETLAPFAPAAAPPEEP